MEMKKEEELEQEKNQQEQEQREWEQEQDGKYILVDTIRFGRRHVPEAPDEDL